MTIIAITRPVSDSLTSCEISFIHRKSIDLTLAKKQHQQYVDALKEAGCQILEAPLLNDHADAVFVEDTCLITDELAIITRTGAESRRGECASTAKLIKQHRPVAYIKAPGTADGGDMLLMGKTLYVGHSDRTNQAGIEQLTELLKPQNITVQPVRTWACLHLKSAVTALSDDTVLIQPAWLKDNPFKKYRCIEVAPDEPHAANVLRIARDGQPDAIIMPNNFPKTTKRLKEAGFDPILVDVGELQKAEGAATCCSIIIPHKKTSTEGRGFTAST